MAHYESSFGETDTTDPSARILTEQLLSRARLDQIDARAVPTCMPPATLRAIEPTFPQDVEMKHLIEATYPSRTIGASPLQKLADKLLEWSYRQSNAPRVEIDTPFTFHIQSIHGVPTTANMGYIQISSRAYDGQVRVNDQAYNFSPEQRQLKVATMYIPSRYEVRKAEYTFAPGDDEPTAFYSHSTESQGEYPLVDPALSPSENVRRVLQGAQTMIHVTGLNELP